jgi:hypothetical protein
MLGLEPNADGTQTRPDLTQPKFGGSQPRSEEAPSKRGSQAPVVIALAMMLSAGAIWTSLRATHARDLALQQADLDRKLSNFLIQDLLLQATTADASIVDLLDQAVAALGNRFDDQPSVHARVLGALGASYRSIGQAASGLEALEKSAELHAGSPHRTGPCLP